MGSAASRFGALADKALKDTQHSASGVGTIIKGVLGAAVIQRGFQGLINQTRSFVTEASKIEDAVAGFTPLLGGIDKANELVARLNTEAATTPFQFDQIAKAANQLLPVMNQDINRTAETFRMLGDTAGGNAQKLDSITRGFTKSMLKGKVDMESLNMIAEAGVPIYDQLSSEIGVTTAQMFKMITAGDVTTDALTNTFRTMTSEGGIFFRGMAIASETLTGRLSTMRDNINLTKAAIGQALLPTIKPLVDNIIELAGRAREWANANKDAINERVTGALQRFKEIFQTTVNLARRFAPIARLIVRWMIAWKIAVFALIAAQKIALAFIAVARFLKFIKMIMIITKIKGFWTAAQWALNAALNANPIGLITAGIFALITATVLIIKHWEYLTNLTQRLWDTFKGLAILIGGPLSTMVIPFMILIDVIRSLVRNFDLIKQAFSEEGLLGGIRALGAAILDGVLSPLRSVLDIIGKFPGKIGEAASGLSARIGGREGALPGGAFSGEEKTPLLERLGIRRGAEANAKAEVSVFKEEGIGVTPFARKGKRGFNMEASYAQ